MRLNHQMGRYDPLHGSSMEEIMSSVDISFSQLKGGLSPSIVLSHLLSKFLKKEVADLIMEMALSRKKARGKFSQGERMFFTSEGLRWATPEIAADHCAKRMRYHDIADLTCGQGGQVISFSRFSDHVLAVDKDPLNCLITRMNLLSLGIENVEVVNSDCLSQEVVKMMNRDFLIFSDPARPPCSSERTMEEIVPDPRSIERTYRDIVSGMCFEVPPYMSLDKVDFDHEAEYLSIDGRINRLNLYLGEPRKGYRSAVVLPDGDSISCEEVLPFPPRCDEARIGFHLLEVDPSVVKAGLVGNLVADNGWDVCLMEMDHRRTALLSVGPLRSPFLKRDHIILGSSRTIGELKKDLFDLGAGSVTIRYSVEPGDYWKIRNDLEAGLSGSIKTNVFKCEDFLITREMDR